MHCTCTAARALHVHPTCAAREPHTHCACTAHAPQVRLVFLLDALVRHLGARRAGLQKVADAPSDFPSLQAATQMLCALCAALDRAPPLEFAHTRLSLREWLREHLELALQREVRSPPDLPRISP